MKPILKIFVGMFLFENCAPAVVTVQSGNSQSQSSSSMMGLDIGYTAYLISYYKHKSDPVNMHKENMQQADDYFSKGLAKMDSKDTNDLKLARQYFKASLALDDGYADTWMLLGEVSMQESKLNLEPVKNYKLIDALYYYNKAIELDSNNNMFYYRRGLCYYNLGDTTFLSDYRKSCILGNRTACTEIEKNEK